MQDDIRWIKTHCGRMDHGGCSLIVGVENNKIVKVKGDPEGFLNKGYLCAKGIASPERLNHPDRLKNPLKRMGDRGAGKWQKISWNEAIAEICENFNRIKDSCGAKSVAFCQGMPKGLELFVLTRLANTFGSPNVVGVQDVCHAPREISGMQTCGFYPVADFHHPSKTIVLWGSNITSTNEEGAICSLLLKQLKNGTELIVIDPRRTELAQRAKYWLQIRPGTDNALALAFLNVIINEKIYDADFVKDWTFGFQDLSVHVQQYSPEKMSEVTWISPDLIRKAARFYAHSRPAAIQWGNPIEQTVYNFDAARALVCLMAICGNLDVAGGNIKAAEPKTTPFGKFVRVDLIPSKRKEMIPAYHATSPKMMTVPPGLFRKAVLEEFPYAVKAAYMHCTNPLVTYADSRKTFEALMKLDFIAVTDIFMTPSASMADIVLPAATHFEFNDIGHYGLGHGYILARPKVVDPPEGCWPDIKILNELGKALTSDQYWYDDYEKLLDEVLQPSGLSYRQFVARGYLKGNEQFKKYRASGFKTPTGKVELALSQAEKLKVSALPEFSGLPDKDHKDFPLVLTSAKSRFYLHSSYRWLEPLREKRKHPTALIHPETAKKSGIKDGEAVIIETRHGEITQTAQVTDAIHPRVINADYGWWFPEAEAESQYDWKTANFNMLTSMESLGNEFGTPNLKGIGCSIRRKS
ncbi:MAG: molybdopterin-dependent oxidoreductase [Deltaproteobacteria bacterium]|jgi:anaerobic selenocysteine-containing dehydrogenase